ncbi:MAG TPA: ferritin-like domain-containing protein [Clostridiaceae bacterium]|nr:ferritin-like domain-containing protein [Clostridiaceae bacterium]
MYSNYYDMYNQYYSGFENIYRSSESQLGSGEIITLNQAINSIRQSVKDEKEDEMFYETLIKQAPTEKEKNIIASIRDDERKHNQILRGLYYEFTGQILPPDTLTNVQPNTMSYKENLEKALFGELDAVVRYRRILGTMPNGNSYTLLMSIMTDELRHASKYNFLIQNAK